MSYLVIARKYRPKKFSEIVGQEHIRNALVASIKRSKVAHALLFTGPRGTGKTTTARIYAKSLNCSNRDRETMEPCGKCDSCVDITNSASIAVREIDGASNNSVDNVRELVESLKTVVPGSSKYKVYIIDEVHMLSISAFNALLKSIEEPPPSTVFILATTEPHKLPETIISRCQRHDFTCLTRKEIANALKEICVKEKLSLQDEVIELISRKANGGMRDAQSMLERLTVLADDKLDVKLASRILGVVDHQDIFDLGQFILNKDLKASLNFLIEILARELNIREFINDFISYFRNLVILRVGKSTSDNVSILSAYLDLSESEVETLECQSNKLSLENLRELFDIAISAGDKALSSVFPSYVLEAGVIKLVGSVKGPAAKIERVESIDKKPEKKEVVDCKEEIVVAIESPVVSNDLNWKDFLGFIKKNSSLILHANLCRVEVTEFCSGVLRLAANKFEIDMLDNKEAIDNIKVVLEKYTSTKNWIVEIKGVENSKLKSLVNQQKSDIEEDKSKIASESKVREALDVFSGSKLEKVIKSKT